MTTAYLQNKAPRFAIAQVVFWATIGLALINHGALDLVTVALTCVSIFTLLIFMIWRERADRRIVPLYLTLVLVVLCSIWIVFQTSPLLDAFAINPAWNVVSEFVADHPGAISLTPADDWIGFLRLVLPLGVFMVGLLIFDNDKRAIAALNFLGISGGLVAFLSIIQFELFPEYLIFSAKSYFLDSLTGIFINRNTAATFFGLITLVNLALISEIYAGEAFIEIIRGIDQRRMISKGHRTLLIKTTLYISIFILSLVALLLTKSRAGIGSTFLAMTFLIFMTLFSRSGGTGISTRLGSRARPVRRAALAAAFAMLCLIFLISLADRAFLRVEILGMEDQRFCVMPGIIAAAYDHFPFGAGLASFEEVFPAYRNPNCSLFGVWNRAHNVYLEGFFVFGIMFPIGLLLAVSTIIGCCVRGLKVRRRSRFGPRLGLASLLLVAAHSALDFSIQISGLAIVFAALLAPVVSICFNESLRASGPADRKQRSSSH